MRYAQFALFAAAAASLYSDANLEQRVSLLECKMDKAHDDSVYPCRSGSRFASGRPVTSGYNLSAFGDVIYWKFYEGGGDFTIENKVALPNVDGRMDRLRFDWQAGYRLGVSYALAPDLWDVTASYTRIKPQAKKSVEAVAGGNLIGLNPWLVDGAFGNATWFLKYSVLNVEFGRSYFVSHHFYLRPHYGAQAAWIHQKGTGNSADGAIGEAVTVQLQNNFDGGGIRIGVDTKWFFQKNWSLVLNGSAAALYGKFETLYRQRTANFPGAGTHFMKNQANVSRVVPNAQLVAGLSWETNFAYDANHLAIFAAYEANYWWRQFQVVRQENLPGANIYGTRLSEDLSSQGLTVDIVLFF